VSISAQPGVISQVIARVVRIFIDHDVVTIPEPIIDKAVIVRRNTEVGAIKPESIPVTSPKVKLMPTTEAAREASMFPGMFHMVVGIVPPGIMSNPVTVCVNVRSFRMARPVGKGPAFWHVRLHSGLLLLDPGLLLASGLLLLHSGLLLLESGLLLHGSRRWTVIGNMPTPKLATLPTLGISGDEGYRQYCKKPNSLLHDRHLQLPMSNWESNAS
jgi:hypothetical protein